MTLCSLCLLPVLLDGWGRGSRSEPWEMCEVCGLSKGGMELNRCEKCGSRHRFSAGRPSEGMPKETKVLHGCPGKG